MRKLFLLTFIIILASCSSILENEQPSNTLTKNSSLEEHLKWKADFNKWAEENGKIISISGEKTRGKTITIAEKNIDLPEDSFVEALVSLVEPLDEESYAALKPHLPYYVVKRSDSYMGIGQKTGYVVHVIIGKHDDSNIFDFMEPVIKGHIPGHDNYDHTGKRK